MRIDPGSPNFSSGQHLHTPGIFSPGNLNRASKPGTLPDSPGQAPPQAYDTLDFLSSSDESESGEVPAVCRWPDNAFPLRLWFNNKNSENDETPDTSDFENLMFAAIAQWEFASGNRIQFVKAETPDTANVVVSWFDEAVLGRGFELAHVDRTVIPAPHKIPGKPEGIITHAVVNLHKNPVINRHFSSKNTQITCFFATILHEFGHVLGLEHSPNPNDVMFYRGYQNARLTGNDVQRLNLLYPPKSL